MSSLDNFIGMLTGEFNNQEQYDSFKEEVVPFSVHKNTIINDKILNLPKDFIGRYLHEESFYTINKKDKFKSDIFLFTNSETGNVVLNSVIVPKEIRNCHYEEMNVIDYNDLTISEKFVPLEYTEKDNIFSGQSKSMFTKKTEFILTQTISEQTLTIKEEMFNGNKMIFGFPQPIVYKKINVGH